MHNYLKNEQPLNIFDICGTLYSVNTTFEYVKFFHKENKNFLRYVYIFFLTSILGKLLARIFNFSIRKSVIRTLAGANKEYLYIVAEKFYDTVLENRKNKVIFNYFEKLDNKILLSASIDPVVNTIGKRLTCCSKSTLLKYDKNGDCLGNILKDAKGNKVLEIEKTNINNVFTDNLDDFDIINKSEKAYLVFPNLKRKRRWEAIIDKKLKISNFEFLKV